MGTLKLLDCTLRDGGYVNDWNFGQSAIEDMVRKLEQTHVEILELGFIKDEPYNEDRTVFNDIEQVKKIIPQKASGIEYAVMAEVVNPLPLEKLAPADADGPEIIRVIVWKRMLKEGFEYCRGIVEKGYKLCVQPARVSQYSDEEFIEMVELFNQLDPMAVYVVDSWGTMYADTLLHYMKLAEEHLKPGIAIGYHGHNNMMQAFAVACDFARQETGRDIFIDASVYGIGRGAGNLNLELFAKYLNDTMGRNYDLAPMMQMYDSYIKKIYEEHPWGFSLPYFISAKYNCNPNFAEYYISKGINISRIEKIISFMPQDERIIFLSSNAEKYSRYGVGI
ncbi:aldolase catalytic domain-containing protein [uncultured Mailhella sp.]|uniref:aldolase catalytic domain-containing protein n=1 Tax=uncultured Mailhella sp. TaxID=1981031 RepID=UPI00260443AB|nr:aldolase catalytic domain-containing protein [uncultured Mailhella sp.]